MREEFKVGDFPEGPRVGDIPTGPQPGSYYMYIEREQGLAQKRFTEGSYIQLRPYIEDYDLLYWCGTTEAGR